MEHLAESPLLVTATLLFFIGLGGALTRRAWPVGFCCLTLALAGGALLMVNASVSRSDPDGLANALIIILLGGPLSIIANAVAIAVYRRRGTVNIDELHELRG